MTKEENWFLLCNIPGFYQNQIAKLLQEFGSPEEIFKAGSEKIGLLTFLNDKEKKELLKALECKSVVHKLNDLDKKGIRFIHAEHPAYPARFSVLEDRPFSFYCKGRLPDPNQFAVGIVGARACSSYGKNAAQHFASALALNDIQIISGMASGIDAAASKGALQAGGKTFVVLGTGVDVIYPSENTDLYYQILMSGGGVLSEYPPGTEGAPWHFPHRNRLISALSDCLLIMEAKKRSGSLTTAQYALQQGIDIFALPGRINDPCSEGCNKLIADGCGILLNVRDLMESLRSKTVRCSGYDSVSLSPGNNKKHAGAKKCHAIHKKEAPSPLSQLSQTARFVYSQLNYEPAFLDDLITKTDCSLIETQTALKELELFGLIKEEGKDYYCKT